MSPRVHRFCVAAVLALVGSSPTVGVGSELAHVGIEGDAAQTVATVEEALAVARRLRAGPKKGPIVITLPRGTIRLAAPIRLTQADSGTASFPLIIRGAADGSTILSGAMVLNPAPGAGEQVVPLAALGGATEPKLEDYGLFNGEAPTFPLLFQGEQRFDLASWPARGLVTTLHGQIVDGGVLWTGPALPKAELPLLVAGYPSADWAYEVVPAGARSGDIFAAGYVPSIPLQAEERLRLLNVPSALGPGRFVLDVQRRQLRYVAFPGRQAVEVARLAHVIEADHAHHVRIERIAVEKSRGTGISVSDSDDVRLADCFVGLTGMFGVEVQASSNVVISRCVIRATSSEGVRMNGGDRVTLTPNGNALRDSLIDHFAHDLRSTRAINIYGVGVQVVGNRISTGPQGAISVSGNDHLITRNEISDAVCEAADAGAVYLGRSWVQRGTRITENFIHDLGGGRPQALVMGVYLDDQSSGSEVSGNVFLGMRHGVMIGGGRDNLVANNAFAQVSASAIYADNRGVTFQAAMAAPGGQLRSELAAWPHATPTWKSHYPALEHVLEDRPGEPVGNLLRDNRVFEAPLLWAVPSDLKIPQAGNTIAAFTPEQRPIMVSGSRERRYRFLASSIGGAPFPGPARPLLFENHARLPEGCGND